MIADYNGLIRYAKLHFADSETLINNYTKLENADKDRVVIVFNAEGNQLKNLKPFINSILDQTVKVNDIALSVPYKDIPLLDKNLKKVISVYGRTLDYKDSGICGVLREPEANTKIIIVDSNIIYGQDFIEKIVEASNSNPEKIIKTKFATLVKPKFFNGKLSCKDDVETCCNTDKIILKYKENFRKL
jgi:hypothetical protein